MKKHVKLIALIMILALGLTLCACGHDLSNYNMTVGTDASSGDNEEAPAVNDDSTDTGNEPESEPVDDVYDGPDDSEEGLEPAVPDFTGTETAELVAPYRALAVEYNGYIYYLDDETNLCRADTNMQNYEMFLAQPLGCASNTAYICGVTNAGMIYIGSSKGSCYLDANNADLWTLATTTFSGDQNKIRVYGISGEWMYYTKLNDTDDYLYRCKLGGGGAFYTEEKVFSFPIWDAALTKEHIVFVCGNGDLRTLSYQSLDALQMDSRNEFDSGYGYYPGLNLVAVQDELVVYSLSGIPLDSKLRTVDLQNGTTHRGTGSMGACAYNGETDELVYFEKCLVFRPVGEVEDDTIYWNSNGYKSDDYLASRNGATIAGDWFFFKSSFDSCGADYFIDLSGMTLTSLD